MGAAIKARIVKNPSLWAGLTVFLVGQAILLATTAISDHNKIVAVESRQAEMHRSYATHQDIESVNKRLDDLREIMLLIRDRK